MSERVTEREGEREREIERGPVRREEIIPVTIRGQCYISETIEKKYSNFDCLFC